MSAASMSFPADAASVPLARRFVRTTLEGWSLLAAYEAAEMLVSEVATNAVLHAQTEFTVVVERDGDRVRIGISDGSLRIPAQRSYGTDSTTGRGMRLVASLSSAWGVDRRGDGKCVWFEVPAAGTAGVHVEDWFADTDVDSLLDGFSELDEEDAAHPEPRSLLTLPETPQALAA